MDIDTQVGEREVTILVEDDPLATLDREWWDEWSERIAGEPQSCIETCLTDETHAQYGDAELREELEERGLLAR
ncbi:MAG: hypothetical protein PPP58_09105 [Natronomonas sp.]